MIAELIEQSEAIVGSGKYGGRGQACEFYKLTNTIGIKTYRYRGKAIDTRNYQAMVAEAGLAPEVMSEIFEVETTSGTKFCYLTELVHVFHDIQKEDLGVDSLNEIYELPASDERKTTMYALQRDHDRMMYECCDEIAEKFSLNLCADAHAGNFGLHPDGRCLCIDFDIVYNMEDDENDN